MSSRTDAFVIWIDAGAEAAAAPRPIRGRVEHVQTSARAAFSTPEELIEFLRRHGKADHEPPESR
jgi:hypothetical protein